MRTIFTLFLSFVTALSIHAQIVINEVIVAPGQAVELKNIGSTTVDVSTYQLCSWPVYNQLQSLTTVSGSLNMAPGDILVVSGHSFNTGDDEMGLYIQGGFGDPANIIDYVEWGSTGHQRSSVAQSAGIWSAGDFIDDIAGGDSWEYDGSGDSSSDWLVASNNSQGEENSNAEGGCEASAFAIGSQSICEGGTASFQMILTGIAPWTFTYSFNGVLQDPVTTSDSPYVWELMDEGSYNLVSIEDANCEGEPNGSVQVNFIDAPTGTLTGESVFCPTDTASALSVEFTGQGPWTITYQIDGTPQVEVTTADNPYMLSVSSEGLHVLTSVGNNSCDGEASGSVDVSYVNVSGGALSNGGSTEPIPVCVDDNLPEQLELDLEGASGSNMNLIITDESGVLIAVAPDGPLDFEGGEAGTCLVWNLSYNELVDGLEVGNQMPDDLSGCYELSNPVPVLRQTGSDCTNSLNEFSWLTAFRLFPNPVQDELRLTFDSPGSGLIQLRILDMTGRLVELQTIVSNVGFNTWTYNASKLSTGTYSLELTNSDGGQAQRLFVK